MAIDKVKRQERRRSRVRFKLKMINFAAASKSNTALKPRLSVFRSNKQIYAQIIDDFKGVTLASASSLEGEFKNLEGKLSVKAVAIGKALGKRAQEKGIEDVVYDRGSYKFHGIVANLIQAVQESFANN
jgi:large subunit ribosomal protein L18